jgi:hypothetical protein
MVQCWGKINLKEGKLSNGIRQMLLLLCKVEWCWWRRMPTIPTPRHLQRFLDCKLLRMLTSTSWYLNSPHITIQSSISSLRHSTKKNKLAPSKELSRRMIIPPQQIHGPLQPRGRLKETDRKLPMKHCSCFPCITTVTYPLPTGTSWHLPLSPQQRSLSNTALEEHLVTDDGFLL